VTDPSDASTRILGVWKLISFEAEIQATGQKEPVMGQNPTGFAIFTETRASFLLTGEARKPAKTVQELADLLNKLITYTGTYRLEEEEWITNVEVAWNPEWVGTEQKRSSSCNATVFRSSQRGEFIPTGRTRG
jgi:hypothetical protein